MDFSFMKRHSEVFIISGLLLIFYFLFFHNIGTYPLMDNDETRYVAMSRDMFHSKDFMTLYLNGEFFFEKPPLYFWVESFSFWFFGVVNEFSARFPVAICSLISAFMMYFTGKKIISRKFGIISALILATSLEFMILSKMAILDMILTTCIGLSLYSGFMTFFVELKSKKYFWWLFYIFSAIGVLAKGIPAFIVPFGVMFFAGIVTKKFKEYFSPQYFLIGVVLFLAIVVPWHFTMFKMHDPLFFNEYIIKHHLSRFLDSHDIGRKQPWFFYLLAFTWGFIPWIGSFLAMLYSEIAKIKMDLIKNFDFNSINNIQKFSILNLIAFVFIILFFSISSTKLITYILAVYFPASFLMAFFWNDYIGKLQNKRSLNISVYIINSIFIIVSIVALGSKLFLPSTFYNELYPLNYLLGSLFLISGVSGIVFALKNKAKLLFGSYVMTIVVLSAFIMPIGLNFDYKLGQNDLIEFASYAKKNNKQLASYRFGRRYSLLYNYQGNVCFQQETNSKWFQNFLLEPDSVVVIKNKNTQSIQKEADFTILKKGRKYSLITK